MPENKEVSNSEILPNEASVDANFDSQNIFDELSWSQEVGDEVQKIEAIQHKDVFFYLKKFNSFSFFINVILFLAICVASVYMFIQTQDTKREYSFLAPVCSLFLWDINIWNTCYWVQSIFSEYETRLSDLKVSQTRSVLPLLWEVYAIENFNLSRKVSFLLEKTNNRTRPLEMLVAFDDLKNKFAPVDKKELRCYNISILEGNILDITCDAFSSDWDTSIASLKEWDSIETVRGWGTSISRASSFIHFIENHSQSKFQIVEKPEALSREEVQELPYTQKTTFHLLLRYNDVANLSF